MELIIKPFDQLTLRELYEVLALRVKIFVVEQNCPYQELDGKDENALHLFLRDETGVQAYLRIFDRGVVSEHAAIGRVVTARHGEGLGDRIMRAGIRAIQEHFGADTIWIEAQTQARGFYERFGFRQISPEFMMDDIPHIQMLLETEGEKA